MRLLLFTFLIFFIGCSGARNTVEQEQPIKLTILQLNDVYEIEPLEGGKTGGMARVAYIRDSLLSVQPNVLTILCGDFLNPSLVGTLKYNGEKIRGRQMVDAMNAAGVDLVTFGNHEFDLDYPNLQKRINESEFMWISSNTMHRSDNGIRPFRKNGAPISRDTVLFFPNKSGDTLRFGVFGVTLASNPRDYVKYYDWEKTAIETYQTLSKESDLVLPVTHLSIDQDMELAEQLPVPLIIGGHEHHNMLVGVEGTNIAKADANAKSVYIHEIMYDPVRDSAFVESKLLKVTDAIPMQKRTQKVVDKWASIADASFREMGFDPGEVVYVTAEPLDGRESTNRHMQSNLGGSITRAMFLAGQDPDCAILNSGAIRVDDQLSGPITQFDIMRTLPYGGPIVQVEMSGELLRKTLRTGFNNEGNGGFLQWDAITFDEESGKFLVQGQPIDLDKHYQVMMPDFLLTGLESNMDFLTRENPEIYQVIEGKEAPDRWQDIRFVWMDYLREKR